MRRYSIRTLMALVVVSAVGLAALRGADETWAGMLLLAALAAVGAAVLGAAILRGRERAWCAGFAFFGGGYLALDLRPLAQRIVRAPAGDDASAGVRLRTHASVPGADGSGDRVLEAAAAMNWPLKSCKSCESREVCDDPALVAIKKALARADQQLGVLNSATRYDDFRQVGHALFAPMAGLIGAVVAVWFHRRRERIDASSGPA